MENIKNIAATNNIFIKDISKINFHQSTNLDNGIINITDVMYLKPGTFVRVYTKQNNYNGAIGKCISIKQPASEIKYMIVNINYNINNNINYKSLLFDYNGNNIICRVPVCNFKAEKEKYNSNEYVQIIDIYDKSKVNNLYYYKKPECSKNIKQSKWIGDFSFNNNDVVKVHVVHNNGTESYKYGYIKDDFSIYTNINNDELLCVPFDASCVYVSKDDFNNISNKEIETTYKIKNKNIEHAPEESKAILLFIASIIPSLFMSHGIVLIIFNLILCIRYIYKKRIQWNIIIK